jgi:hypothetical protein
MGYNYLKFCTDVADRYLLLSKGFVMILVIIGKSRKYLLFFNVNKGEHTGIQKISPTLSGKLPSRNIITSLF